MNNPEQIKMRYLKNKNKNPKNEWLENGHKEITQMVLEDKSGQQETPVLECPLNLILKGSALLWLFSFFYMLYKLN